MLLGLLAVLCGCVVGDPTTININFEGLFQGLNWNGPSPAPAPTPAPETYLPIPNGSQPAPLLYTSPYDQNPYHVSEVSAGSGAYYFTNGFYNGFFIVGPNGVWVFDVPGVYAFSAIKNVTTKNITHIVYSHTHVDHIGATSAFIAVAMNESRLDNSSLVIIATQWAHDHLQQRMAANDTRRPLPTMIITNQTFTVGSLTVQLTELDVTAHLEGSIMVWIPEVTLIMLVDVAFPGWAPFYALGMAKDFDTLVPALDLALAHNFTVYVGGHMGRYGNKADVEQQKEYILSVFDYALDAQNTVGTAQAFVQALVAGSNNPWVAFKVWGDKIADACYEDVLARWGGILGGVDVMSWSHCWELAEHIRIN